ncbi:hypothetical protein G6F50_018745 [Rhizopus delemar]|uniref:Uncharacterized protein n=1 Tax=Rhizopus delemar TaxID=936053 RepID=A0A9P7BYJ9_9FUNG|nr:hypothetical protein G6F50_018745 [Rhizopus delemar]
MGPLADSAYAVEPVGVAMIRPSARCVYMKAPSNSTRTSIMPPRPARFSTTSFKADAEYIFWSPRHTLPSSSMRSSI